MRYIYMLVAVVCALTLAACSSSTDKAENAHENYSEHRAQMESDAQRRLAKARVELSQGKVAEARKTLETMRRECYLAIDARNQGILLMDSVAISESRQNLSKVDSLMKLHDKSVTIDDFNEACRKVQFYEQKLRHDSKR